MPNVWGIDLGQCALRAIQLRPGGDKLEVVNHVYLEHAKILSAPDADRPALIAEAMSKFIEQHDLTKDPFVVAVPGQHTLARFTKLPPVDKKKIPQIVQFEAQQQIPFDMDEVIWDYQVFERQGGTETEVGIFAMRRDLLREQLHPFASRNLEPAAVQSAPLALYNALRYDGVLGDESLCILDIGAQNTDLIVVDGQSLWTRNIPLGGNNFTEALLKTFKLSFRKAERLKRDAQKHKYARQIFQAMRPAFADLVAEVQRSIGFFTSSRRGVRLNKIIAMGNAFRLPGMVKFLQQNLGLDVVRPNTFNKLSLAETPNAAQLTELLPSYGVAYGLALQGLGLAPITSNLLPPEIAKQVVWRRKTPWFYASAACLLLSATIVWGVNIIEKGTIESNRGDSRKPAFVTQFLDDDTEHRNPMPDPKALEIVRNGPKSDTPVGRVNEIIAAGQHLNDVLSQIQRSNEDKIAEATELAKLQGNKLVWPAILHLIHSNLPQLEPELAKALAEGPEAYKKLITEQPDKYKREKRKQIFIDSFTSVYCPDVLAEYRQRKDTAASPGGVSRESPSSAEPVGPARPGFLITLKARTPNEGELIFVSREFLSKLRGAAYGNVVHIAQADSLWREQIKDSPGGGALGQFGFRSGRTAVRPSADSGDSTVGDVRVADEGAKDPVTGESTMNDWAFEVIIAVVLGEKNATPAPAAVPAGNTDEER